MSNQLKDFLYAVVFMVLFFVVLGTVNEVCAREQDTIADTLEVASYTVLLADWAQTLQIRERDDLGEGNTLFFGEQPSRSRVNMVMGTQALLIWYLNRHRSNKERRLFNGMFFATRLYVVKSNLSLGLEVKF